MKTLLLLIPLVFTVSYSHAIPVTYGSAPHSTTEWQELATYDQYNNEIDPNGIFWSVDGGLTWGRQDLQVGQTVTFQFNMHKEVLGTHYADHLKAWIDWDQSGTFEESEAIIYAEQALPPESKNNNTLGSQAPALPNFTFYSSSFTIDDSLIGDLWLRGRVTCSHSLVHEDGGHWNDQWKADKPYLGHYNDFFSPTGDYYQGEAEEWKIVVNASSVPDVGGTFLLLGSSLCLGFLARRKTV